MTEQEDRIEINDLSDDPDDDPPVREKQKKQKAHPKTTTAQKKGAVKKLQEKIEELEESLETAEKDRDEFKDRYLRTLAEIDNFRKRVKKEKEEYQKYVLSEFLLDLLQVYDNLERALKAKTPSQKKENILNLLVSEDEKSIISGVEMIYKQFSDLLKKYNVVEIEALNRPFDPNIHQALSKEEKEGIDEPTVIEVYQKGFMYNDKLLKPTLTKVAVPKEKVADSEDEADDEEEANDEEE
jgi:molecular chaperone GrpE